MADIGPSRRSQLIEALSTNVPGAGAGPQARRQAVDNMLAEYRVIVPEPGADVWMAPSIGDDELSMASAIITMLVRLPKAAQVRLLDYLQARAADNLDSSDRVPLVERRGDDPAA
jgi:hypothetical protein